jgi:hypothetical protein
LDFFQDYIEYYAERSQGQGCSEVMMIVEARGLLHVTWCFSAWWWLHVKGDIPQQNFNATGATHDRLLG